MQRRSFLRTALAAPLVVASTWRGAQAQGLAPIRYASVGGTTDAAIFLAQEFGFFKDVGLEVHDQRLDGAAALLAAIATEQLDVAGISLTPGLLSSIQQGINLRVVGDKESIRKGFSATQLVARNELAQGTIETILPRLKGRTVAVSGKTSASFLLLGLTAQKYGMSLGDFRVVELVYANMIPALGSGAIDAAVMLEPFLSQALIGGTVKSFSDFTDVVPADGASIVPIVYSEKFTANRKLADAFMLGYMRAVRAYNDALTKGTDKDRVETLIARRTGMRLEVIQQGNPVGFEPDQLVNTDFLESAQKFFLQQKFLRAPTDVHKLVDPSFAAAAVRQLGPYKL